MHETTGESSNVHGLDFPAVSVASTSYVKGGPDITPQTLVQRRACILRKSDDPWGSTQGMRLIRSLLTDQIDGYSATRRLHLASYHVSDYFLSLGAANKFQPHLRHPSVSPYRFPVGHLPCELYR